MVYILLKSTKLNNCEEKNQYDTYIHPLYVIKDTRLFCSFHYFLLELINFFRKITDKWIHMHVCIEVE